MSSSVFSHDKSTLGLWSQWGPYLAERQWGTVREADGRKDNWRSFTYEDARHKPYRFGEDGIFGISDSSCSVCLSYAFWNSNDDHLKERYFGLTNEEGAFGEDVKEIYAYKKADPRYRYLNANYIYPHSAFPYEQIRERDSKSFSSEGRRPTSINDLGGLLESRYFDINFEMAKNTPTDIYFKLTVKNESSTSASITVLPQIWFRKAQIQAEKTIQRVASNCLKISANMTDKGQVTDDYYYYFDDTLGDVQVVFTDNDDGVKDAFNRYIVRQDASLLRLDNMGTKAGIAFSVTIPGNGEVVLRSLLSQRRDVHVDWAEADEIVNLEMANADIALDQSLLRVFSEKEKFIAKKALANLLWNRLYYQYDVTGQSDGKFKDFRFEGLITAPDKWENPYLAIWDSAFHAISLATVDPLFAKKEITNSLSVMHTDGALPSDEYGWDKITPPVVPFAVLELYKKIDKRTYSFTFLRDCFSLLQKSFSWWLHQEDVEGKLVKNGGIVGVDYVCLFQRNHGHDSNDAVVWSGMFAANILELALELSVSEENSAVTNALQYFEIFQQLTETLNTRVASRDGFFFPSFVGHSGYNVPLYIYHSFGYIPLLGNLVVSSGVLSRNPIILERIEWLSKNPRENYTFVKYNDDSKLFLISWLSESQFVELCKHIFDENKFLSQHGIRTMSKEYQDTDVALPNAPSHIVKYFKSYAYDINENYGGNSNWHGAVNIPYNYLILQSLSNWAKVFENSLTLEFPTGSGKYLTLQKIIVKIAKRVSNIFLKKLPALFDNHVANNPESEILFYEYYDGDTGQGGGASHKCGWNSLIIKIMELSHLKRLQGDDESFDSYESIASGITDISGSQDPNLPAQQDSGETNNPDEKSPGATTTDVNQQQYALQPQCDVNSDTANLADREKENTEDQDEPKPAVLHAYHDETQNLSRTKNLGSQGQASELAKPEDARDEDVPKPSIIETSNEKLNKEEAALHSVREDSLPIPLYQSTQSQVSEIPTSEEKNSPVPVSEQQLYNLETSTLGASREMAFEEITFQAQEPDDSAHWKPLVLRFNLADMHTDSNNEDQQNSHNLDSCDTNSCLPTKSMSEVAP